MVFKNALFHFFREVFKKEFKKTGNKYKRTSMKAMEMKTAFFK